MNKILDLNPNQQKLVKRLKSIISEMDKNNIGTIIQTYDTEVSEVCFYNREKVVWSSNDEVEEVGACEEMDKNEIANFCSYGNGDLDYLKEFDKLTWCSPDASEMYTIPFVDFFGKAPEPYQDPRYISFLTLFK